MSSIQHPRWRVSARQGVVAHASLMALLTLAACTSVKVSVPPLGPVPAQFKEASAPSPVAPHADAEISRWWRQVRDPELNQLIDEALAANLDIQIALMRVQEARTVVTQAESALYPTVEAYGAVTRTQTQLRPPDLGPFAPPNVDVPLTRFNSNALVAAWEVDLFGSRHSDIDAARQAAMAYEEREHGAQLMVAADVATNYVEARSLERRLDVLRRVQESLAHLHRYVAGRFEAGQVTRLELDRVDEQAQSVTAQKAPLQTLLQSRLRRLAVLRGLPPESATVLPPPSADAPADASVIPRTLPDVLPSIVLERRPDVRGSMNVVMASAAQLGSAKADMFPRFYIGFLSQDGTLQIGAIPGSGEHLSSWGAGVRLPIFEGGRIKANIEAKDARLRAVGADYKRTVLSALEDVENAYGMRHALDQRAQSVEDSWVSARDGEAHARALFEDGSVLLQQVLNAQVEALQKEDEAIQAQTARALATVFLYKALGGGWQ